jgi:hypothetical protein
MAAYAIIASLLFVLEQAAALLLLLVIAAATGTAILGSRVPLVLRSALGLAVAGQLFVLLGMIGELRPRMFVAFAVIAIVIGAARWSGTKIGWGLAFVALPLFVLALYPPVAFDETLYHLPTVSAVARAGAIRFFSDLRFPVFPELHELLCVPMYLAAGDVATHMVAVAEAMLLAGIVIVWPRERSAGYLAAALVLGNPIVMQLGSVTHVEAALALFIVAGFYCIEQKYEVLAGLFLGTACSVKYLGGYFAIAALLYLLLFRRRAVPRLLLGLAAGVIPMFGWITLQTHNPVFPFMFGSTPWSMPLPRGKSDVWRLFWNISFARQYVNWQPPYSPLFALSLLVTLIASLFNRRAAFLSAMCIGYIAIFTQLPQDSRYLLPLLPLVSVAAATIFANRLTTGVVLFAALMAIVPGLAYAGYRISRQGPPPLTEAARQQYLEQHIPEFRALEHRGPGRIWVCGAEQLKYFGGDELFGDVTGPYRSAESVPDVRYVLIARGRCASPAQAKLVYADNAAELWLLAR